MTKLIYPNPVTLDGQLMVSTEILTHYRCPACNLFSSGSDIETVEAYCRQFGAAIRLPELPVSLRLLIGAIYSEYDKILKSGVVTLHDTGIPGRVVKTNAISPDAGMPERGVK